MEEGEEIMSSHKRSYTHRGRKALLFIGALILMLGILLSGGGVLVNILFEGFLGYEAVYDSIMGIGIIMLTLGILLVIFTYREEGLQKNENAV